MKKIINGRLYDTDTAKCVGCFDNDYEGNDSRYEAENLYCKKTGEFFLYGWGGPMSSYAETYGTTITGGEVWRPLSIDEAKKWAEHHLSAEKYIKLFGEVEE
ncbi:hypothetical protein [uncultured Fibrobacter sp.]|jgi:hypothetical protein|uniref:hypothetical protein n=1 Tax=uncultured Fibrobacter sp. TaxID=261512 RepID=UPI000B214044|nr:hypothetical protein [uncultured Fibrobacter sp.]MBR6834207.1 hypothetical protein [Fibrobacter sp.]